MVGSKTEIKAFQAEMALLYEMLAFVREEAERCGFIPQEISKIELAAEEALVNIIHYAFRPEHNNRIIEIESYSLNNSGIKLLIRDQGIEYNPLTNDCPIDPNAPLDERTLGGYGIFFIKNLMDEVHYERQENSNVLTLIKYT